MRWPKYWNLSFKISPSSEHSGLISFRIDRFVLLAVQGTLKSLLQHYNSNAHSFSELLKPLRHNKAVIHEGVAAINLEQKNASDSFPVYRPPLVTVYVLSSATIIVSNQ